MEDVVEARFNQALTTSVLALLDQPFRLTVPSDACSVLGASWVGTTRSTSTAERRHPHPRFRSAPIEVVPRSPGRGAARAGCRAGISRPARRQAAVLAARLRRARPTALAWSRSVTSRRQRPWSVDLTVFSTDLQAAGDQLFEPSTSSTKHLALTRRAPRRSNCRPGGEDRARAAQDRRADRAGPRRDPSATCSPQPFGEDDRKGSVPPAPVRPAPASPADQPQRVPSSISRSARCSARIIFDIARSPGRRKAHRSVTGLAVEADDSSTRRRAGGLVV